MKLWLDDVRTEPEGWTLALTADEAIALLRTRAVEEISLDHDLGSDFGTPVASGYDVAAWIETAVANGEIPLPRWSCHSSNPVGRQRIEAAMRSAERFAGRPAHG